MFEKDVLPILRAKCLKCHGESRQKAGLNLGNRAAMMQGGEGGPALTPGSTGKSLLWRKVVEDKMPPDKAKDSANEKAVLKAWTERGAPANSAQTFLREQSDRHRTSQRGGNEEMARQRALADMCHILMTTNEFLYVK